MSLQPAAGSHGELAGVLLSRAYHEARGERRTRQGEKIADRFEPDLGERRDRLRRKPQRRRRQRK